MGLGTPKQDSNDKKDAPKQPTREELFASEYKTACLIFGFRMPFTPEEIGVLKGAMMEERQGNHMGAAYRAIHAKNPDFINALIAILQDPTGYQSLPLINWREVDHFKMAMMPWLDRFLDCVEREADLDADQLAIRYIANPRYHGEDGRYRPGYFTTHPFFPVSVWRDRIGGGNRMAYGRYDSYGYDNTMGYWEWVQNEIRQIMHHVMQERMQEQAEMRGETQGQSRPFFGQGGRVDTDELFRDVQNNLRAARDAQSGKNPPQGEPPAPPNPPEGNEPKS